MTRGEACADARAAIDDALARIEDVLRRAGVDPDAGRRRPAAVGLGAGGRRPTVAESLRATADRARHVGLELEWLIAERRGEVN